MAPPKPRLLASKPARAVLFAVGWMLVALGIAGFVLPLLPGTPFLIAAAACFARSSPRFERWLLSHPKLGPAISNWRSHGVIPARAKYLAVAAMMLSFAMVWRSGAPPLVFWISVAALCAAALYVLTRPSARA
jgi:uncharacterized membrane protein YbaN (DUF454 family)